MSNIFISEATSARADLLYSSFMANELLNIDVWAEATKLFHPMNFDQFFATMATINERTKSQPIIFHRNDPEQEVSSIDHAVFAWEDIDEEGIIISLTRQVICVHDSASVELVEGLIGFSILHGVPLLAGETMIVHERAFTGYEPSKPDARVMRLVTQPTPTE